ncbi:MAG: NUDIX domain-containing protein [Clostridiales bacterium]|nr:NUDIX domain-containing protein [Clostridiales bacterium]
MTYEVSCGAVVFTRAAGQIKYVIIKSTEGWYGFPKGHVEPGETEAETALREIYEETGLKVTILPGFRTTDEHGLPKKPGVIKRVIYFAAEYSGQEIRRQEEELSEAKLMSFDEAMSVFQFESSRRILREAHDFLSK